MTLRILEYTTGGRLTATTSAVKMNNNNVPTYTNHNVVME